MSKRNQRVTPDLVAIHLSVGEPTVWQSRSYAPAWFSDARREAHSDEGGQARRREIVFAVCFVESYLFEWVRDEVLKSDFRRVDKYFPQHDSRGIRQRWKETLKNLHRDSEIPAVPDFESERWKEFCKLVDYRNGLVHAGASRPDTELLSDKQKPVPSGNVLGQLEAGWALSVADGVVRDGHIAVGSDPPAWLNLETGD